MLEELLRGLGRDAIRLVEFYAALLAVGIAFIPLFVVYDRLRRRYWPPREDPKRRAEALAWAKLKAEAEERTYERDRDPHELKLPRVVPTDGGPPPPTLPLQNE